MFVHTRLLVSSLALLLLAPTGCQKRESVPVTGKQQATEGSDDKTASKGDKTESTSAPSSPPPPAKTTPAPPTRGDNKDKLKEEEKAKKKKQRRRSTGAMRLAAPHGGGGAGLAVRIVASKRTASPGDEITLTYRGGSFAPGSKVKLGDKKIAGKRSDDGKSLSFKVPKDAEDGPVRLEIITNDGAPTNGPELRIE